LSAPAPGATTELETKALVAGLQDYGYVEGQTIQIDWRYHDPTMEAGADMAALMTELLARQPDIIVAGGTPASQAAQAATQKSGIPVVSVAAGDPVGTGLVQSLAHPGGNITGVSNFDTALHGKRLELLQELVRGLTRVGYAYNLGNAGNIADWEQLQKAATPVGVSLRPLTVSTLDDLEPAVESAVRDGVDAIMLAIFSVAGARDSADTFTALADLCARHQLPSMGESRLFAENNGLIAYGSDPVALFRRAAYYVSRILAGVWPADLPVEQPTIFDLAVNRTTAEALGIAIPPEVAAQVTEWVP
jgi:putative ABC transport system substrate-binding protein